MSIFIKGMEMLKHAAVDGEKDTVYKCAVLAHPDNTVELVIDEIFVTSYYKRYNGNDIQHYPLTEIPIPHSRLIDADKLLESFREAIDEDNHFVNFFSLVDDAPTIIEAEVSE